jgi:hypothetical protein
VKYTLEEQIAAVEKEAGTRWEKSNPDDAAMMEDVCETLQDMLYLRKILNK